MTADASDFYEVTSAEQLARLHRLAYRALPAWELDGAELAAIKYRENAVFAVRRGGMPVGVLRLHRPGYRSDAEIRSEHAWMRALAEHGIHTPGVIPTAAGEPFAYVGTDDVALPRRCDLLEWVDGAPLGTIEAGVAGTADSKVRTYRTVGEIAARIHDFGAAWSPPARFTLPSWDVDSLVGDEPAWGRFWELECLDAPQRAIVLSTRDEVRRRLAAFGRGADRFGLIHGDFLPENILVADGCPYLIDFNDSGTGWYLFELATSLFFLQADPDFDAVCGALLEGYRSVRPQPFAYDEMMPTLMIARGLSYLGWPHSRPEIDEARELAPMLAAWMTELCDQYLAGDLTITG